VSLSIYIILNTVNGKVYVGKTAKSVEERWKGHVKAAFNSVGRVTQYYIHKSMRKHGLDAFVVFEIDTADNIDQLNELEKYHISVCGSTDPTIGYNCTLGGDGPVFTDAIRKKLSEALKGKKRPRIMSIEERQRRSDGMKGKANAKGLVRSLENRERSRIAALTSPLARANHQRISKYWLGKHLSEETKAKIKAAKLRDDNPLRGKSNPTHSAKMKQYWLRRKADNLVYGRGICQQ
jgi:group I intron endonuclease